MDPAIEAVLAAAMTDLASNRDKYVRAWLAETGLMPSEAELVQTQHGDGTITMVMQRRSAAGGPAGHRGDEPEPRAGEDPEQHPPG